MTDNSIEYWEGLMEQAEKEVYEQDKFQGQEITREEFEIMWKQLDELYRRRGVKTNE
jgi:hypothetical protein